MDKAEIRQYVVGPLDTNAFAVIAAEEDETGKRPCLVVDPGAAGAQLAEELSDVHVVSIVCTHGHADHVSGVAELKAATDASFAMNAADVERATHTAEWTSHSFAETRDAPKPDRLLTDGDTLRVGGLSFRVLEAPGHTPGGIVLLGEKGSAVEGVAFVGDTIFAGSVGRTDLAGGDFEVLSSTLKRLAAEIDDETVLLCGHGPATSMGNEKSTNSYIAPLV